MKDFFIGLLPCGTCYLWWRSGEIAERSGDREAVEQSDEALKFVSPVEVLSLFAGFAYVMTLVDSLVLNDTSKDAAYALVAALGFKLLALGASFLPSRKTFSPEDHEES